MSPGRYDYSPERIVNPTKWTLRVKAQRIARAAIHVLEVRLAIVTRFMQDSF
jgi:hypothetical protein